MPTLQQGQQADGLRGCSVKHAAVVLLVSSCATVPDCFHRELSAVAAIEQGVRLGGLQGVLAAATGYQISVQKDCASSWKYAERCGNECSSR
jgi:hypothetical protein